MLRFEEWLNELFSQSNPFNRYTNRNNVQYEFSTAEGKRATMVFLINNFNFDFISKRTVNGWELFFEVDGQMHVTGKGETFMVLATVVQIVKDFIEKNNPQVLVFTANKGDRSRADLYATMVKELVRLTDFAYNIPQDINSPNQEFVLYIPQ